MADEELIVRGLTGVDMALRIAGPGTRSFAFLIDWQIRLLAALALVLLAVLLRLLPNALRPLTHGLAIAAFVLAPLIYFLYHPVLEVLMRGRTPGKRRAGARIVTVEGATPTVGSLLMRNLFRLIDSMPGFYMVGLGCCLFTAQRVRLARALLAKLDPGYDSQSDAALSEDGLRARLEHLLGGGSRP